MLRNMVTSVFKYERIKTTKAKALEVRKKAEKMITRAKIDSVHNRRIIAKDIKDKAVLAKLFLDVAPRFTERNGGYTRIIKLGRRDGDAAEVVFVELVERPEEEKKKKKKEVKKETEKAVKKETESGTADKKPAKKAKAANKADKEEVVKTTAKKTAKKEVEKDTAE